MHQAPPAGRRRPQRLGGRAGRIRTGDPLLPKQVRYQAALQPVADRLLSCGAIVGHSERDRGGRRTNRPKLRRRGTVRLRYPYGASLPHEPSAPDEPSASDEHGLVKTSTAPLEDHKVRLTVEVGEDELSSRARGDRRPPHPRGAPAGLPSRACPAARARGASRPEGDPRAGAGRSAAALLRRGGRGAAARRDRPAGDRRHLGQGLRACRLRRRRAGATAGEHCRLRGPRRHAAPTGCERRGGAGAGRPPARAVRHALRRRAAVRARRRADHRRAREPRRRAAVGPRPRPTRPTSSGRAVCSATPTPSSPGPRSATSSPSPSRRRGRAQSS